MAREVAHFRRTRPRALIVTMALARYWFVSTLRRRWHGYVGLGLLLGITGGLSLLRSPAHDERSRPTRGSSGGERVDDGGRHRPIRPGDARHDRRVSPGRAVADLRGTARCRTSRTASPSSGKTSRRSPASTVASSTWIASPRRRAASRIAGGSTRWRSTEAAADDFGYRVGQKLRLGTYDPADITPDAFANPPAPVHDDDRDDRRRRAVPQRSAAGRHRPLATDVADARVHPCGAAVRAVRVAGAQAQRGDADVATVKKTFVVAAGPRRPTVLPRDVDHDVPRSAGGVAPLDCAQPLRRDRGTRVSRVRRSGPDPPAPQRTRRTARAPCDGRDAGGFDAVPWRSGRS